MYYEKVNESAKDILNRFSSYLDDDLEAQEVGGAASDVAKKRYSRKQFAAYLTSVATHSIGLRASISPFNCTQEQILIYIMEMFKLKEAQLERILTGGAQNQPVKEETPGSPKSPTALRKRHSWRPELRIRLYPPTYLYDEQGKLDDLSIRVHLFKDPKLIAADKLDKSTSPAGESGGGGESAQAQTKGLMKIFKRYQLDPSILIRPSEETRYLVRFVKFNQLEPYKMVYAVHGQANNSDKIIDDIHLSIRRNYCEPNTAHILRLEFWSDTTSINLGNYDKFKRFVRYSILSFGCFKRDRPTENIKNMDKGQKFYGFVNIRLTNVPSYAFKRIYPVMTLKELRTNNCEVCLEIRNRRILDDTEEFVGDINNEIVKDGPTQERTIEIDVAKKPKKSGNFFIINHLRLYANCLLYQALSLNELIYFKIGTHQTNITLDNLLYLPAYTLVNQHRLQSNLNQLEDQSLRRTAILNLLLKLEQNIDEKKKVDLRMEYMKYILISVAQNEYMTANKPMDDRTYQEVDPFREDPTQDSSRDLVVDLESIILKDFVDKFILPRLKNCFIRYQSERGAGHFDIERSITLLGLRLCSFIIALFENSKCVKFKLKAQAPEMKKIIEKVLVDIILKKVKSRLLKIIKQDKPATRGNRARGSLRARRGGVGSDSPWRRLLFDIRLINNDICLYWSREGLHGLGNVQQQVSDKASLSSMLYQENLKDIIEAKINDYVMLKRS